MCRTAQFLFEEHGEADIMADAMLGSGNQRGRQVWKPIIRAIEELPRRHSCTR